MVMEELSPSQRTASTARIMVTFGAIFIAEALWRGSAARTILAAALLGAGGWLLSLAKRNG